MSLIAGRGMSGIITKQYRALVAKGEIEVDPAQEAVADHLDRLASAMAGQRSARSRFGLRRLARPQSPRGLYIHGGVGRGKTMLMDLFFDTVEVDTKRRSHFHEFMAEVHERIQRGRSTTEGDPIPEVAAEISGESGLMCLDEFQVTDIADAMILGRLFKGLFAHGLVLVATSNAEPQALYPNGLNRQLFLPFIAMLEDCMDIVCLDCDRDFRLQKLAGRPLYFVPADARAKAGLDQHWERLTGKHPAVRLEIDVKGRKLAVPQASMGVARFAFADLCERPLGALDYLHIAHKFHTVMIDAIPRLGPERRNEARRFVTLIDALYDNQVSLIASADGAPDELYPAGDGALMFERTASRLIEMRSEEYLARSKRQGESNAGQG